MKRWGLFLFFLACLSISAEPALAQALPRIAALYPAGARAGSTLEVAIRGGGLEGAREILWDRPGLTARLSSAAVKIEPGDLKLFQAKCALCHELRGPSTISRTADQWVATVDRMIKEKGAPIEAADRAKIVSYVQAAARSAAGLTAQITVAPGTPPGRRELRVLGLNGTSTAFTFEVTDTPEVLEVEPNNTADKAQAVTLPVTINGQIASGGDVDCFAFQARQGERVVMDCSAFRLNPASQTNFFPVLYLFDAQGRELARNSGYHSLDPLLDWTAPADGRYVVQVRDMLYRGSPSSVYRLTIGSVPYDTYLFPAGGRRGETAEVALGGQNVAPEAVPVTLPAEAPPGIREVATRWGVFPFAVGSYPEYVQRGGGSPEAVTLPASINGRLQKAGAPDRYVFPVSKETAGPYTFEVFAQRLGLLFIPRLSVRNAQGQVVGQSNDNQPGDPRLTVNLGRPGDYTLEVEGPADKAGPQYVYRIGAARTAPDFEWTLSPDNPNLGPGSSVYLPVQVRRRVGFSAPIEISFPQLPAGVTASPTILAPDQGSGFVILTAAADAHPGVFSLARPVAKAVVNGESLVREAIPRAVYLINNNQMVAYPRNMVVTVGPEAEWSARLEMDHADMSPGGAPVRVTLKVTRRIGDRDIPFAVVGVPPGVQGPGNLLLKKGASELSFTLTPTGGLFQRRAADAGMPRQFLLAVYTGREGEGMQMASPAVPITVAAPAR